MSDEVKIFIQQQLDIQTGVPRRIVGEREIDGARQDALGQRR